MTPFILKGRVKLPPEDGPSDFHVYDQYQQLWIDRESGMPVVSGVRARAQASKFGETTITETQEGTDQPEIASIRASQFGETTITKTSEGCDQPEVTLGPHSGEASSIATPDDGNTTDTASVSLYAPYSHF